MATATGPRPPGSEITAANDWVPVFTAHTTVAGGGAAVAGTGFLSGPLPRVKKNAIPATPRANTRTHTVTRRRTARRFWAASFLASHLARISGGGQSSRGGRSSSDSRGRLSN